MNPKGACCAILEGAFAQLACPGRHMEKPEIKMSYLPSDPVSFLWGAAAAGVVAYTTGFLQEAGSATFGWISRKWSAPLSEHDKELFRQFQDEVAAAPTLRLFKTPDFDDAFSRADLRPLNAFVENWGGVEREFMDKRIEKAKKRLHSMAEELANEIGKRTCPVGDGTRSSVYSDSLRSQSGVDERPAAVIQDACTLNALARPFGKEYESFLRLCRKRLNE